MNLELSPSELQFRDEVRTFLRAELPKPDGELTGQAFFRALTDFLLTLPNGRRTTAIHVYEQVVAESGSSTLANVPLQAD